MWLKARWLFLAAESFIHIQFLMHSKGSGLRNGKPCITYKFRFICSFDGVLGRQRKKSTNCNCVPLLKSRRPWPELSAEMASLLSTLSAHIIFVADCSERRYQFHILITKEESVKVHQRQFFRTYKCLSVSKNMFNENWLLVNSKTLFVDMISWYNSLINT
jgi:hypothetical protein